MTVSWHFEPRQPQWITSGLNAMLNPSSIYSAHKSSNHNLSQNHKINPDTNLQKTYRNMEHKISFMGMIITQVIFVCRIANRTCVRFRCLLIMNSLWFMFSDGDSDTRQIVSDVLQGGTGCTYQRPMILASLIIFDHIIFITIISSVIMLKEQRNISSFNWVM